jgi:hypothetical protein
MTITNSWVVQDPPERDGSGERIVTYVYEFHNGEYQQRSQRRPATGFDYDAEKDSLIADMEQQMIDQEDEQLINQYESKESLDPLDAAPVHPETDSDLIRRRRFRRKFIRKWVRSDDMKKVRRYVYPLWYWLKFTSGYTVPQIEAYLGVTTAQLSAFDSRMQAYHDNLAFIDAEAEQDLGD